MVTTKDYSNTAIDNAGRKLLDQSISENERNQYVAIVDNWRALHAAPLVNFVLYLRKVASNIDASAIVVQRLKRMDSIIHKLERQTVRLSRMQDIGGCRVITKDTKSVYDIKNIIIGSSRKHKLLKEDDYIKSPKSSGYRGIHLIYQYCTSQKTDYNNTMIEIQLRTKLQHLWATSVEAVGTFRDESLKSGQGSQQWQVFFKYVSTLFALEEKQPTLDDIPLENLAARIVNMCNELNLLDQLKAFNVAANIINDKKSYYYVLDLNYKDKRLQVYPFAKNELDIANDLYARLEIKTSNKNNAVLVSADSIHNLKKAYPNYFMDIKEFVTKLEKIIKKA